MQELLTAALAVVGDRHSATEIKTASWLIREMSNTIYNEVLLMDEGDPDLGPPA